MSESNFSLGTNLQTESEKPPGKKFPAGLVISSGSHAVESIPTDVYPHENDICDTPEKFKEAAEDAAKMAKEFEGFSATAYLDTLAKPPVWTVGYGSIWELDGRRIVKGRVVTRSEAEQLLSHEMIKAMGCIQREEVSSPAMQLSHEQVAALMDFIYNVGTGNFQISTLLKYLRAGKFSLAASEFEKWDMAGGKHISGLLRRRAAEKLLFNSDDCENKEHEEKK